MELADLAADRRVPAAEVRLGSVQTTRRLSFCAMIPGHPLASAEDKVLAIALELALAIDNLAIDSQAIDNPAIDNQAIDPATGHLAIVVAWAAGISRPIAPSEFLPENEGKNVSSRGRTESIKLVISSSIIIPDMTSGVTIRHGRLGE